VRRKRGEVWVVEKLIYANNYTSCREKFNSDGAIGGRVQKTLGKKE